MKVDVLRSASIAIAAGLVLKGLLFLWGYLVSDVTPLAMMGGHDGAEYLRYAEIIGNGATGQLPPDVLRHDPGLPLLLAGVWLLSSKLLPLPFWALLVQLASWMASVMLFAKLCSRWCNGTPCNAGAVTTAAIAFPALLYFGQFNLTEPLFITLIFSSFLMASSGRWLVAFALAGVSALVRSTGLLLVVSLLFTHPAVLQLVSQPRIALRLAGYAAAGLLPWLLSQAILQLAFETNISTYKPTFGLPFSGFRGLSEAGLFRSVYIVAVVGLFVVTAPRLVLLARKERWSNPLRNMVAVFAVMFLVFHLCLRTLYYIDREVWTFDYQDRYLLPLWPLAVLAWRQWISWSVTVAFAAGAWMIAAYWLRNYIMVAGL